MLFKIKATSKKPEFHETIIQDGSESRYVFRYDDDRKRYAVYELDSDNNITRLISATFNHEDTKRRIDEGDWKLKGKYDDQGKNQREA